LSTYNLKVSESRQLMIKLTMSSLGLSQVHLV
jgi:hypothetical protein